jgi:hypothetical protein
MSRTKREREKKESEKKKEKRERNREAAFLCERACLILLHVHSILRRFEVTVRGSEGEVERERE